MTETEFPETAKKWLKHGYQVAVYENHDMSSPEIGHRKFMRIGKDSTFKTAPKRLPDTPTEINWRYQLIHVHKKLKEVV